jgi:hypothetical protein
VPRYILVYVTFNQDITLTSSALAMARSQHDGATGTFATDSTCSAATLAVGFDSSLGRAQDAVDTPCPDPEDSSLYVAGSVVADKSPTSAHQHDVYVPFVRHNGNGTTPPISSCR